MEELPPTEWLNELIKIINHYGGLDEFEKQCKNRVFHRLAKEGICCAKDEYIIWLDKTSKTIKFQKLSLFGSLFCCCFNWKTGKIYSIDIDSYIFQNYDIIHTKQIKKYTPDKMI